MDQDRPRRGRPGRPRGQLRGEWVEVRELAQFLRNLMEDTGSTLRALAEDKSVPYGRDAISDRISGEYRPDWEFVKQFVQACLRSDLAAQKRMLLRAERLWERAGTPVHQVADAAGPGTVVPGRDDLDARQALQRAGRNLDRVHALADRQQHTISALQFLLGSLTTATQHLAAERDALRARLEAETTARRQAERELQQLRDVRERLAAAQTRRQRAEAQLAEVHQQMGRTRFLIDKATFQEIQARRRLDPQIAEPPGTDTASASGQEGPGDDPAAPTTAFMNEHDQAVADEVLDGFQNLLEDTGDELDALDHDLDDLDPDDPALRLTPDQDDDKPAVPGLITAATLAGADNPPPTPANPPASTDIPPGNSTAEAEAAPVPDGTDDSAPQDAPAEDPLDGKEPAEHEPVEAEGFFDKLYARLRALVLSMLIAAVVIWALLFPGLLWSGPDVMLAYAEGDRSTLGNALFSHDKVSWRLPPGKQISTTWTPRSSPTITGFTGTLRARNDGPDHTNCWGKVQYTLYADGHPVNVGTLHYTRQNFATTHLPSVDLDLPAAPRTVGLSARRIDSAPCAARLDWSDIGLNRPGAGPANGFSDTARKATG